ncbi:MAG TPA: hypothetical protein EYP30_04605 [Archaeoglobaceae archaeon]|nr:hypothetical protein [Archaeoglobaceae archaeon]
MDVWLGDFDELDAKVLSKILRDSGIRNKIKPTLEVDLDWYYYAEGRFSELKNKYTDFNEVFEEWENYIKAIRSNLIEGIDLQDFEENVLDSILPGRDKVPSINKLIEKYNGKTGENALVRAETARVLEKFSEEEREEVLERFKKELEISILIRNILRLNGISFEDGKIKGRLPDDPILRVYMDIDDELAEKLKLDSEFTVSVEKANHLYVNLIDAIKKINGLKKICEERSELFELLLTANSVIKMLEKLNKVKKIEEFIAETSSIKFEGTEINISKDAIEDILKALKKEGLIDIRSGQVSKSIQIDKIE